MKEPSEKDKKKDCNSIGISFYFTFITSWYLQRLTLLLNSLKVICRETVFFFPQHRQFFIDTNFETRNTFPVSKIDAAELKGRSSVKRKINENKTTGKLMSLACL